MGGGWLLPVLNLLGMGGGPVIVPAGGLVCGTVSVVSKVAGVVSVVSKVAGVVSVVPKVAGVVSVPEC